MNNAKVKLDSAAIRRMLKSEPISDECRKYAEQVRVRAGEGFKVEKRTYPERTGYAIYPANPKATAKNYNENILEKAIRL